MSRRGTFWAAQDGGAAAEYALVLPVIIGLMVGALSLGSLGLAASSLRYAVAEGARCAAVKTNVCRDATTTVTYAEGRYSGPQIGAQFSATTAGCGHTVTGSGRYTLTAGIASFDVPLTASACFP